MAPDTPSGSVAATTTTAANGYHDYALVDMMEAMRRSNVATYAIDPRGKVESKDLTRECFPAAASGFDPCSTGMTDWESAVRQAQHGLEMMSEASGGFAVTNTDDFTSGLEADRRTISITTTCSGSIPTDTKGKGYRPLDVKVPGHPDWKLRFRRGYKPGGAPARRRKHADPMARCRPASCRRPICRCGWPRSRLPGPADVAHGGAGARSVGAAARCCRNADGKLRDTLKYEVLVVDEKKARVRIRRPGSKGGCRCRRAPTRTRRRPRP